MLNIPHPNPTVMAIAAGALLGGFAVWFIVRQLIASGGQRASGEAGGLNYVVGPMGSGKSMFGVRVIVAALVSGRYVVTNVRLYDGWESMVCRREFPADWRRPERRARREAWLGGHYVYATSLAEAMRYRLPAPEGHDERPRVVNGKPPTVKPGLVEGRGVCVWDESHNELNNRDYQGHGRDRDSREHEKEHRRLVLRWATQLRKLGYVGYLLSQHQENTDAQLRRVCNHVIRLQNQRQQTTLGKVLPRRYTMFLARWFPAHLGDGATRAESIRLDRYLMPWHRHLYDSWETFHGLDDELVDADGNSRAPILLPRGGRHERPRHPAGAGPRVSGDAPAGAPGDAERREARPGDELASRQRSVVPGRRRPQGRTPAAATTNRKE